MAIIFDLLDVVGDVLDTVTDVIVDVVDWVVDDIVRPVVVGTLDVIKYAGENPIEAAAKLALTFASGGYYAFLIPLVDGAATLAKGGSINDALKATALSYAASKVGGKTSNYVSAGLKEAGVGATVSSIITTGATKASVALVYGQDPLKAFLAGGVNAGVGAALGMIDTKLTNAVEGQLDEFDKPIIKGWEDLQDGVKDSISAALAAELDGGSFTADTMGGIINKYTGVASTMEKFLKDNVGLNKGQAAMLTSALTQAATTAIAGNPEMSGEAFFAKFDEYGMEKLKELADKPVDKFIDKLDGSYQETEAAAEALNTVMNKTAAAADGFNSTREELNGRIAEQTRLEGLFDTAAAAYAANPSQTTADAQNDTAAAYTMYADQLKIDYDNTYKPQMDAYTATYEEYFPQIEALDTAYKDANQYMISDIDNLSVEMKPVFTGMEKAVALTLRPGIDEDAYRKATGIEDDVDIYRHYLENQRDADQAIFVQTTMELNKYIEKGDFSSGFKGSNMSEDRRPDTSVPTMPMPPNIDGLPNVDLTVPPRPITGSGRGGDPRDYGLTPEDITAYKNSNGAWGPAFLRDMGLSKEEAENYKPGGELDAWYNFSSGGLEAAAFTVGGAGTLMNEISENIQNAFKVDNSRADEIAYSNYPIIYDSSLTPAEKKARIEENVVLEMAARDKAEIEQGVGDITTFTGYTDPIKNFLMGTELEPGLSIIQARKISPEMQVRQMNALPAPDTAWGQILSGNAKDRLGRPYGLGDPVATLMSGVQELPDLLVDIALLAITKNPAVLARSAVAVTGLSALEAGEAAADEIEAGLNDAYKSGKLQGTAEFADLVRAYGGDEDAALAKLIDQGMGYAAVSGAIGGIGDLVLAKVATASGGSALLSVVPKYLQPIVKVGTGGLSEGINEALEQVPVNLAGIYAGLDKEISTDTGAAFLSALTAGGSTTATALAIQATVQAVKDGKLEYKMPDGSTFTPDKPEVGSAILKTSDSLFKYSLYSDFIQDGIEFGAIPEDIRDRSGSELISSLELLGIDNTDTLVGIANVAFDSDYTTKDEIAVAVTFANPDIIFTDEVSTDLYEKFGGEKTDSDVATAVAAYIEPLSKIYSDAKKVAEETGIEVDWSGVKETYDKENTSEEEVRQMFADIDYTPSDEEVQKYIGATAEAEQLKIINAYVDPLYTDEGEAKAILSDLGYKNPTDEEIAKFTGQTTESKSKTDIGAYVGPRMVSDAEARQFFADLGYENPTDEQVAQFVAQVSETEQADVIAKYVDPRQVTRDEVQAIADEEGLTLTDALAAAYVGQGVADNYAAEKLAGARTEYDPLATTEDEAAAFFADTNYTATPEEIADFVASKTEEIQKSAIGGYVDPRQMTAEEAKAFLSEIGYNPTDEEVAQFTGQLNDATYQTTQKVAIDEYVDPRYVDAGEVRAAYEELGLVGVDQADIDKFVGQFDEETQLEAVRDYVPVATTNVIRGIIGSPSVKDDPDTEADESKDATGIYAQLEDGATRDEALEAALAKLTTDLGVTEAELLKEIGLTKDDLVKEIDVVAEDVADVKEDVTEVKEDVGEVKEDVGDLADILGTAGVADDPATEGVDESADPTGLFATIKAYEDAGFDRDTALQKAIDEVSTALGTTKTDLLTAIGETETTLTGKIDTATDTLTETIGEVEADLSDDIQAVADLVGKPAREVTQDDIDFVADLIAQENVTEELTLQYDVTGDGIVDILDQNLLTDTLQGTTDTTLADTSIFDPATGLFLQQETDTQTTQDMVQDMNTQINTNIETNRQQQSLRDLLSMEQQGMFKGAKMSTTPAPLANIDYLYDIGGDSVFATEQQAGLFASPYGGTRAEAFDAASKARYAQRPTNPLSGYRSPRMDGRGPNDAFAQGGQVEDENDILLKMIRDM